MAKDPRMDRNAILDAFYVHAIDLLGIKAEIHSPLNHHGLALGEMGALWHHRAGDVAIEVVESRPAFFYDALKIAEMGPELGVLVLHQHRCTIEEGKKFLHNSRLLKGVRQRFLLIDLAGRHELAEPTSVLGKVGKKAAKRRKGR